MRTIPISLLLVACATPGPRYTAEDLATLHPLAVCRIALDPASQRDDARHAGLAVRARNLQCDGALPYIAADRARQDALNVEMFRAGQAVIQNANPPVNPMLIPPPPMNCTSQTIDGRTYTTCR